MRAESTGSVAESSVRGVLLGRGYSELSVGELNQPAHEHEQTRMFGGPSQIRPTRFFVAQYPIGLSIYGQPLFADFWVMGVPSQPFGLAIEVKWQQSAGSVDEKFPYLVHNIKDCYPCSAVVIADGGGQRPGALQWLRSQAGDNLLAVFSLAEFMAWANRYL
jgi:hypothetical protein